MGQGGIKLIRLVIFDADGVLINSTQDGMENHQLVATHLGLKKPSIELMKKLWGKTAHDLHVAFGKELGWTEDETELFHETYYKLAEKRPYTLVHGIDFLLSELKKENFFLAIVSSRDKASLAERLSGLGININIFKWVLCCDNNKFHKPDPRTFDVILAQSRMLKIKPEEIVFIGDTIKYDYEAARNNKPSLKFIGMTSGLHEKSDFIKAGLAEKYIANNGQDLYRIIKNNF